MGTALELQLRLASGHRIALSDGARITPYELSGGWGTRSGEVSAEVSEDPHNRNELRLRNLTGQPWIAIMPDGERLQIDYGSGVRLKLGLRINFGPTYGEIVDANAPSLKEWQPEDLAVSTPGNFIPRHWRGELSLPVSFWVNGVLLGLAWRLLLFAVVFLLRMAGLRSGIWMIVALVFDGAVAAVLTAWTVVGIWRSAGGEGTRMVWLLLARIGAVVLGIATVAQIALAVWQFRR